MKPTLVIYTYLAFVIVLLANESHGVLLTRKCISGKTMYCECKNPNELPLTVPISPSLECPPLECPSQAVCPVPEPTVIMPPTCPTSWLRTVSELSHGVKALFSVMFPIVMACGTWISRRIHVRRCGSIVRSIETQTD